MTKDIIGKLRDHLSQPVNTECTVMYLLAEIRKILDRDDPQPEPFALWMYCHWALHVDLTRPRTTRLFLKRIDDFVVNNVAGFTRDPNYSGLIESHRLFREFLYLDSFRNQLRELLRRYDLSTDLCDKDDAWFSFWSAYAGIVEDGAISCKNDKQDELQAVSKVVFSKGGQPIAADSLLSFVVQWDIHLKDRRICRTGFEAQANKQMLFWGLQLIPAPVSPQPPQQL